MLKFFSRRECIVPTVQGWLAIALSAVFALGALAFSIHPFLSPVHPIKADVLVVEGWMPEYALAMAAADFKNKGYRLLLVTGGPLETGHYLTGYGSLADVGALTLRKIGIDSSVIVAIPSEFVQKDRTYEEGVALKKWLSQSGTGVKSLNLYSLGCHSRRSQLLYSKALGKNHKVGIVACPSRDYDSLRWWRFSSGVRAVADEALAYFYSLVFVFGS
jgi:hypothetical protein